MRVQRLRRAAFRRHGYRGGDVADFALVARALHNVPLRSGIPQSRESGLPLSGKQSTPSRSHCGRLTEQDAGQAVADFVEWAPPPGSSFTVLRAFSALLRNEILIEGGNRGVSRHACFER